MEIEDYFVTEQKLLVCKLQLRQFM